MTGLLHNLIVQQPMLFSTIIMVNDLLYNPAKGLTGGAVNIEY